MKLSKTSEYAIRVLVFLATRPVELFSVNRLHRELDLPYKYLGRLMSKLAEVGIVSAVQGKQGGFQLARPAHQIFLNQIVVTTEGLDNFHRCVLGFDECSDENPCALHNQWGSIQADIEKMLFNSSLAELAAQPAIKH